MFQTSKKLVPKSVKGPPSSPGAPCRLEETGDLQGAEGSNNHENKAYDAAYEILCLNGRTGPMRVITQRGWRMRGISRGGRRGRGGWAGGYEGVGCRMLKEPCDAPEDLPGSEMGDVLADLPGNAVIKGVQCEGGRIRVGARSAAGECGGRSDRLAVGCWLEAMWYELGVETDALYAVATAGRVPAMGQREVETDLEEGQQRSAAGDATGRCEGGFSRWRKW